jgi:hypothetical protein
LAKAISRNCSLIIVLDVFTIWPQVDKTIITFKKALVLLLAFLLAAIHDAGLVSLTPSPMNFISKF